MFDHVTIGVADAAVSSRFYERALGRPTHAGEYVEWDDFSLQEGRAVTRGLHTGFEAPSRRAVDEWWRRLTEAGHPDDGAPGPRPEYGPSYYGAFVRDPDGNSVEAVHNPPLRAGGNRIDHLWLRTRDVAGARRFWEAVAPTLGIGLKHDTPDRIQYVSPTGTFSFLEADAPTENVHLAFPVADNVTVAEFHLAAVAAGYADNGGPGERANYHPGYFGAFVVDPDGHNIEAVCHNR
jgi:catechol 2,3-dioxygenase-like lactoylglutathione lyase family enzyme